MESSSSSSSSLLAFHKVDFSSEDAGGEETFSLKLRIRGGENSSDGREKCEIEEPQLEDDTCVVLWPICRKLCSFLIKRQQDFVQNKRIVEVGAGLGACSLLASRFLGAKYVLMTDMEQFAVENMIANRDANGIARKNCEADIFILGKTCCRSSSEDCICNKKRMKQQTSAAAVEMQGGEGGGQQQRQHKTRLSFDVMLASDILFLDRLGPQLVCAAKYFLKPGGVLLLAHEERRAVYMGSNGQVMQEETDSALEAFLNSARQEIPGVELTFFDEEEKEEGGGKLHIIAMKIPEIVKSSDSSSKGGLKEEETRVKQQQKQHHVQSSLRTLAGFKLELSSSSATAASSQSAAGSGGGVGCDSSVPSSSSSSALNDLARNGNTSSASSTRNHGVLTIISGDLLNAREQYIAHQCNCVTNRPKGLSEAIFSRYPDANIYAARPRRGVNADTPGAIIVRGRVINMLGQRGPGRCQYAGADDTAAMREGWFAQCLTSIANIEGIESVAFPYMIGCGLAGGNWGRYLSMLERFASENPHISVALYQKKD